MRSVMGVRVAYNVHRIVPPNSPTSREEPPSSRSGKNVQRMYGPKLAWLVGPVLSSDLAPDPGIRTLNLAVNRSPRLVQKWSSPFAECYWV